MVIRLLSFLRDWTNPADFPAVEPDEAKVRADLQYHANAVKDYINQTLAPAIDTLSAAKHTHTNAQVLDNLKASDVQKWDDKVGVCKIKLSGGGPYTADKTYSEIKAAIDAGQFAFVETEDGVVFLPEMERYEESIKQGVLGFHRFFVNDEKKEVYEQRLTLVGGETTEQWSKATREIYGRHIVKLEIEADGSDYTVIDSSMTYDEMVRVLEDGGELVAEAFTTNVHYYMPLALHLKENYLSFACPAPLGMNYVAVATYDVNLDMWAFYEVELLVPSSIDSSANIIDTVIDGGAQDERVPSTKAVWELIREAQPPVITGQWRESTGVELDIPSTATNAHEYLRGLYAAGKRPELHIEGNDWTAIYRLSKVSISYLVFSNVERWDDDTLSISTIRVSDSGCVYSAREF